MKRILIASGLAVVAALVIGHGVRAQVRSHLDPVFPSTIVYHDTYKGLKEDLMVTRATRANGDTSHWDGYGHRVNLNSEGRSVLWNPQTNLKTTSGEGLPIHSEDTFWGASCERYGGLTGKSQTILGFTTLEVIQESKSVGKAGERELYRRHAWIAPALGCKPLLTDHMWFTNEVLGDSNHSEAVSAIAGEPDPQLFAVPEYVKETEPSAFWQKRTPSVKVDAKRDTEYRAQLAKRQSPLLQAWAMLLRIDRWL